MYKFIIIGIMLLLTAYGVYALINTKADIFFIVSEIAISVGGITTFILACEEGKEE